MHMWPASLPRSVGCKHTVPSAAWTSDAVLTGSWVFLSPSQPSFLGQEYQDLNSLQREREKRTGLAHSGSSSFSYCGFCPVTCFPGIHVLCSTEVSVSLGPGDGVTIPCFKTELINSLHTLAPKVPAQRPTLPGSVVLPRTGATRALHQGVRVPQSLHPQLPNESKHPPCGPLAWFSLSSWVFASGTSLLFQVAGPWEVTPLHPSRFLSFWIVGSRF